MGLVTENTHWYVDGKSSLTDGFLGFLSELLNETATCVWRVLPYLTVSLSWVPVFEYTFKEDKGIS